RARSSSSLEASLSVSLVRTCRTLFCMSSASQPRECAMKGNGGNTKPLGPEGEHRARDRLDVVLATCDDEGRHLVPYQHLVLYGDLVLHAVQALDHLGIQRGRIPPANGRAEQYDVGPLHQPRVDCRQLIPG